MAQLLTRDEFRNSVFERDRHRCVICGSEGNSMLITSLSAVFGLMADVASEAYND